MSRIGFFGGTFDPIHNGHLNLAISLLEQHSLDKVLFCPAKLSPVKEDAPPSISGSDRQKMVELAIEGEDLFSLCTLELEREGPSYTIDTIRLLKAEYPHAEFFLILGEDQLKGFDRWKDVETLTDLATPLVGTRLREGQYKLPPHLDAKIQKGKTPIHPMEISSTELRSRLKKKMYCGHLIPSKVLDFIEGNRLY